MAKKKKKPAKLVKCRVCGGSGWEEAEVKCLTCKGTGKVKE